MICARRTFSAIQRALGRLLDEPLRHPLRFRVKTGNRQLRRMPETMWVILVCPRCVLNQAFAAFKFAKMNIGDAQHCLRLREAGIEVACRFCLAHCALKLAQDILTGQGGANPRARCAPIEAAVRLGRSKPVNLSPRNGMVL
jgi:hypothetical protein